MARFNNGWVKISRQLFAKSKQDNPFFGDGLECQVFLTLISWANYRDGKAKMGSQEIEVKRGQLITSVSELVTQTGFSTESVRRSLRNLQKSEKINNQTNKHGTVITVCNYDLYQEKEEPTNKLSNERPTNAQQTPNKRPTNAQQHIEEEKKERREEGKNPNMQFGSKPFEHTGNLPSLISNPLALMAPGKTPWTKTEIKAQEKKLAMQIAVSKTARVWQSYCAAYFDAYGFAPKDNGKVRGQASRLIDLLGEDDAVSVADWFLREERGKDGWLIAARHPFGELLESYQTYYGNFKAGKRIPHSVAKKFERQETIGNAFESYVAKKRAAEARGNEDGVL